MIAAVADLHAIIAIAGDQVGSSRDRTAYRVAAAANLDTVAVGQCGVPSGIGANSISENLIAAAVEIHAVVAISGDEVGSSGNRAADGGAGGEHEDAVVVGQCGVPGSIGADGIAQHLNAASDDVYTRVAIAGDEVGSPRNRAADRVAAAHKDAVAVGQCGVTGRIGADVVA